MYDMIQHQLKKINSSAFERASAFILYNCITVTETLIVLVHDTYFARESFIFCFRKGNIAGFIWDKISLSAVTFRKMSSFNQEFKERFFRGAASGEIDDVRLYIKGKLDFAKLTNKKTSTGQQPRYNVGDRP